MSKDYYNILEVDRNASLDDIKKSYRNLSKKYHPDLNKEIGSEEKFKEVAGAYEVLSDPDKKARYDQYGSDGPQGFNSGGFDFNDIFSGFGFNPFGGKKSYRKGSDSRINVSVSLEDILNGVNKKVKYKRKQKCTGCDGKGGKNVETCPSCNGAGSRISSQNTPFGTFQTQSPCNSCSGSGKRIIDRCGTCHGSGLSDIEETVSIDIPRGVAGGMTLQMSGKGNSSPDGHYGDLLIHITEEPHKSFRREDSHVIYKQQISIFDLLTGYETEVEMLGGKKTKLKIEPGTKCDNVYRFSKMGLPNIHSGGTGDFFVELDVDVPKLTPDQIEVIKTLK